MSVKTFPAASNKGNDSYRVLMSMSVNYNFQMVIFKDLVKRKSTLSVNNKRTHVVFVLQFCPSSSATKKILQICSTKGHTLNTRSLRSPKKSGYKYIFTVVSFRSNFTLNNLNMKKNETKTC